MSQIGLPFDWQAQVQAGSFLVSEANHIALRHIEGWQSWPVPISILIGPARSGKTTLGEHFTALSNGTVIDDVEDKEDQALFHQWNMARDSGRPLLMIARSAPASWPVSLPDLRSRLSSVPQVHIQEPDDALLRQLIETGLAQAGSAYAADVPEWLSRRTERSYGAVTDLLVKLNHLSLSQSRKISVPLLRDTMREEDRDVEEDSTQPVTPAP